MNKQWNTYLLSIIVISFAGSIALWTLFLSQSNSDSILVYDYSDEIQFNLYSSTQPYNSKINYQKGLELVQNSKSLIGDGIGLGSPIIINNNSIFFSSTSTIEKISNNIFKKTFIMDAFDTRSNTITNPELNYKLGNITINYIFMPILNELRLNISSNIYFESIDYLVIANEVNSEFTIFTSSNNDFITKMPSWSSTNADIACLEKDGQLKFCVDSPGILKYYGRESSSKNGNWAGISLFINSTSEFSYKIIFN